MADTQYPIQINIAAGNSSNTVGGRIIINIARRPAIRLSDLIISSSFNFLDSIFETYINEDTELKTLVNYGDDKQSVIVAKRYGVTDTRGVKKIQLKLLQPVPDTVGINSSVFISRELAKSVIDKVRSRFAPPIDDTPYLRPKNLSVVADVRAGKTLSNINLEQLSLVSGSIGADDIYKNKTFQDEIFRKWYSFDFNSTELNIDFTDYNNFIFYSSAAMRLEAFKNKLLSLEKLENDRRQILSSSVYTPSFSYAGFVMVNEKTADYAKQKEEIIRGFDRYEQYLYFTSGSVSPYSASAYYADSGQEYNSIGYWPKSGSELYPVSSQVASDWYDVQLGIAQRFDDFNENNIINTIPSYLREDSDSASYITFVSMIGHFFDTIKLYIDQYSYIYNRELDPNSGLSKDLISDVAESFGFTLPTLNSIYNLTDNILGSGSVEPRRDLTSEIYKRIMHNLPFFAKAKGSKTALETFIKTFGITPQLLTVKETGRPVTSSVYSYDEYTTGLDFDETTEQYIILPLSSSLRNPKLLQFNCTVAKAKQMTLLTGDDKWGLDVVPHPVNSSLGQFRILSGSSKVAILSSSYGEFFGDELLNISIDVGATESALRVIQVDSGEVIFDSNTTETTYFTGLWNNTQYIYMGGAGPLVSNKYDGTLDEIRLWNKQLSDEIILNTALDPGSNAGDTYDDPVNNLIVQLSFNNVSTSSLAASTLLNESPYKDVANSPSLVSLFTYKVGSPISESDFIRYNRTVTQKMINAGSSGYITGKITVAPPPQFSNFTDTVQTLRRTDSIVKPDIKRLQNGRSKIIVAASPTDIINQNIIRNFGLENINAVLGSPSTLYTVFDKSLSSLKKFYEQYYYVSVSTNKFIRILADLGSVLNEVVDYFIPSKATALRGIVIEPNILEQVKIPTVKNIRFYGKDTRKTINAPGSLTSSAPDYGATFNLSKNIIVPDIRLSTGSNLTYKTTVFLDDSLIEKGSYNTYLSSINPQVQNISSSFNTILYSAVTSRSNVTKRTDGGVIKPKLATLTEADYKTITSSSKANGIVYVTTGSYNIIDEKTRSWKEYESDVVSSSIYYKKLSNFDTEVAITNKIKFNATNKGSPGAEPYNRVYTRKLFNYEINTTRLGGTASLYIPTLREIPPSADFRDSGVYTYFSNPEGIYFFSEIYKAPAYPRPLNQESKWNSTTQQFVGIPTWSYQSRYTILDVVYQNVTDADIDVLGETIVKASKHGNGNYYVFKTRPQYTASKDDTSFYLNTVPTFLPPAVDTVNWDPLKFKTNERRVKKRVVFDTYVIPDPIDNNFKTTTISIDKVIDIPARYNDRVSIGLIAGNEVVQGEVLLQNIGTLFTVQSTVSNIRLRLYRTAAARTADVSRAYTVKPKGFDGVLLDTLIDQADTPLQISPIVTFLTGDVPENGKLYYTIDNLDSSTKLNISIYLYYFALQIEPRVPQGYLKKHYKFFRDTSTATNRRNYEGCKNTKETTIDGEEPIQIFLTDANSLVVGNVNNQEINIGGGGTLNVT